jgi:D-ribose-binding periplasmic protein
MKRELMACLLVLVMGLSVACSSTTKIETEKKKVIAFSNATTDSPYYVALQESAKAVAEAAGYEFRLANAANNVSKQNQDVQDLIQGGADIIILNPCDTNGAAPAVNACKEANIPLVTVNRPVAEGALAHVGEDNFKMGQVVGEKALELLGRKGKASGKILEILGSGGNQNTINRSAGFHKAFEGENVEFIQTSYCDFNRAKAVTAAQDMLQANQDVVLIFAHNDDMALGGMQVAEQNGMKLFVCGIDGLMEAVKLIPEEKYHVTTMNDPQLQGKVSVETAIKVLNGEKVLDFVDVGTQVIDKSNAEGYITDKVFATQVK